MMRNVNQAARRLICLYTQTFPHLVSSLSTVKSFSMAGFMAVSAVSDGGTSGLVPFIFQLPAHDSAARVSISTAPHRFKMSAISLIRPSSVLTLTIVPPRWTPSWYIA